jgi:hypothetical protein
LDKADAIDGVFRWLWCQQLEELPFSRQASNWKSPLS